MFFIFEPGLLSVNFFSRNPSQGDIDVATVSTIFRSLTEISIVANLRRGEKHAGRPPPPGLTTLVHHFSSFLLLYIYTGIKATTDQVSSDNLQCMSFKCIIGFWTYFLAAGIHRHPEERLDGILEFLQGMVASLPVVKDLRIGDR